MGADRRHKRPQVAASHNLSMILVVFEAPPTAGDLPEATLWDPRWRGWALGNSQVREAERKLTRLGDVGPPLDGASEWGARMAAAWGLS